MWDEKGLCKVFPKPRWSIRRRISRFHNRQPDTNLCCETTDTGLVYRVVCLFTSQLEPVPIVLLGDSGTWV